MPNSTSGNQRANKSRVSYWLGDVLSHALGVIACIMLFAMMVITFIDVGGRYLFASPLPAAYEIISLIMPGIIFCALPYVCRSESHVTIDLMDFLIPPAVKRWQKFLVSLFSCLAMGFVAYRLYARFVDHLEYGDVTDELFLPLWPFSLTMAILCAISTLTLLANTFAYLVDHNAQQSAPGVSST